MVVLPFVIGAPMQVGCAIHDLFLVGSIRGASMQEDCGIITLCLLGAPMKGGCENFGILCNSVIRRGSYTRRL